MNAAIQIKFSRNNAFESQQKGQYGKKSQVSKKYQRRISTICIQAYGVVITGSTKGVGKALAEKFLERGDKVVISSRKSNLVDKTIKELKKQPSSIYGITCNMAKPQEVQQLAQYAKNQLGNIDIWINNAGSNAYSHTTLTDAKEQDVIEIIETNMLGVLLGCKEAIKVMKDQQYGGDIFNMDGAGADGFATPRFAAYGATKRGLQQFQKSLASELKLQNIDNVTVHNLSPGMVVTDLLLAGSDTSQGKFFINCLAEQPETVAQYLVPKIHQVASESQQNKGRSSNKYIKFLTPPRAYWTLIQRLLFQKNKDRWIKEE